VIVAYISSIEAAILTVVAVVIAVTNDTLTITVGAIVAVGCTVLGAFLGNKLNKIHVLVNSRLTTALDQIAKLTGEKANLTGDPVDIASARQAAAEAPGVPTPKEDP